MRREFWRVGLVLAVQFAILAAIPVRQARARLSGVEITLETVPVDPYDLLSGYYVTLRYAVEVAARAGEQTDRRPPATERSGGGGATWMLVRRAAPAWELADCCLADRPRPLPDGLVALRVEHDKAGAVRIPSAGRFFIPESRRTEIDSALRASGGRARVDLKVGEDGSVALLRLHVGSVVVGASGTSP